MAAFNDFLDLRTAVIEHVGRPDIADVMPRLVQLAEARFNRELRLSDQITQGAVTITLNNGLLPDDLLEVIGLSVTNGAEFIQQPVNRARAGRQFYSISGSGITTEADGDLELAYYAAIPTISGSLTATNWLLAKYPEIYLYGVGFEGAKYVKDAELAQATKALLDMAITDARADDDMRRYSRARVRVMGVTP